MTDGARYRAFISYSHVDAKAAAWLQRALETYRLPNHVAGTQTARGKVPARLNPIFRDRSELAASHSLTDELQAALSRSDALIVVCSPASAGSKYVAAEIEQFRKLHENPNILALLVDGEPGDPEREPFPEPLRGDEPIAADLRAEGDGKRGALLKLIAGLTGVGLDDLIQRDAQRRATRMRWIAAAATVLAVVMAGLSVMAIQARNLAEQRQEQAEGLVEYMLTDLRGQLEPVGRLEALDGVGERALEYYAEQDLADLSPDALGRRADALHLIGEVRMIRGDSEAALEAFREAAATTGELLERYPDNGDRIFDHSQSSFWVGYIAWQRGQRDEAREFFERYADLAERLVDIDPNNASWALEPAYAGVNLGLLAIEERRADDAIENLQRSQQVFSSYVNEKQDDLNALWSLSQAHAYLSDAYRVKGDFSTAIGQRDQEAEVVEIINAKSPENFEAKQSLLVNRNATAQLAFESGAIAKSREAIQSARRLANELLSQDSSNARWKSWAIQTDTLRAHITSLASLDDGLAIALQNLDEVRALFAQDQTNEEISRIRLSRSEFVAAHLLTRAQRNQQAITILEGALQRLRSLETDTDNRRRLAEALYLLGVAKASADREAARQHWMEAAQFLEGENGTKDLSARAILARTMQALGNREQARSLDRELARAGYRHPVLGPQTR